MTTELPLTSAFTRLYLDVRLRWQPLRLLAPWQGCQARLQLQQTVRQTAAVPRMPVAARAEQPALELQTM